MLVGFSGDDRSTPVREWAKVPNGRPAPQLPNGRMNLKEGRSLGSYVNHANASD